MSHEVVEKNIGLMIIFILIVISFGGLAEIVPLFFIKDTTEPTAGVKPYSALRLFLRQAADPATAEENRRAFVIPGYQVTAHRYFTVPAY